VLVECDGREGRARGCAEVVRPLRGGQVSFRRQAGGDFQLCDHDCPYQVQCVTAGFDTAAGGLRNLPPKSLQKATQGCKEMDQANSRFGSPSRQFSLLLVVQTLHLSIATGESRRDVYARPYFRGRAVCPRADIEIGSLLAGQTPDSPEILLSTGHLAGEAQTGQTVSDGVSPSVDLKSVG